MSKIDTLTQDKSQKQTIIKKIVAKIDVLADKSSAIKKTLLTLLKNDLMKEIGENLAYR
jgi:hypothetical protein